MSFPRRRIPFWVCVLFTVFVAVMAHNYYYVAGPSNFLFFCDFACFVTCLGLWAQSPLLLGTSACGILVTTTIWVLDLIVRMTGHPFSGMTEYMFQTDYPEKTRLISTFHGWLPMLLIWAVRRVGYDRRSLPVQCVVGTLVLIACYRYTGADVNINYVHAPPDAYSQHWMPPVAWLCVVIATAILGLFVPADLVLRLIPPPPRRAA